MAWWRVRCEKFRIPGPTLDLFTRIQNFNKGPMVELAVPQRPLEAPGGTCTHLNRVQAPIERCLLAPLPSSALPKAAEWVGGAQTCGAEI